MWDPASILTVVGIGLTFLLNVYQSVKSRHFELECSKCVKIGYDSQHQDHNSQAKPDDDNGSD